MDRKCAKGVKSVNYKVINIQNNAYIELKPSDCWQLTDRNILDLIAVCMENRSELLLLHGEALSEDFFKLSTGVAGEIIQKLVNYHIKTAAIISDELKNKGRFREMALEANRSSSHFRFFNDREAAEAWLTSTI